MIQRFFIKLFLLPFFGGFATVAGICAGYLGSLYVNEISNSLFQLYHPAWFGWEGGAFDWRSTLFWAFCAISGLSFSGTFWAQAKTGSETNEAIKSSLKRLMTLPPEGFLVNYADSLMTSNEINRVMPTTMPLAQLEKAVRVQLSSICNVCSNFDANGRRTRFAANVMSFMESGNSSFISQQSTLQTETRCLEAGVSIANIRGVLRLQVNLSAAEGSTAVDTNLSPMCLPIPKDTGSTFYIPGAPLAFAKGKTQVYRSQEDLIDLVDANRQFSLTVLNDLKAVLEAQSGSVHSLICIPLFSDLSQGPGSVIGVLNIHRNSDDPYIQDKIQNLEPLLAPLVRNLEVLLWLLP